MHVQRFFPGLLLLLSLAFAGQVTADWRQDVAALRAQVSTLGAAGDTRTAQERFEWLVTALYEYQMLSNPEFATYLGEKGGDDRWTDQSLAAIEQRKADELSALEALRRIDKSALEQNQRLNYELLLDQLGTRVDGHAFPSELLPINQMSGVQQDVAQMMSITRPQSLADYENMLQRLDKVPALVDQTIETLREGMRKGVTPPKITLRDVPDQVRSQLADDPADAPVLQAFRNFPDTLDELQREALTQRANAVFSGKVAPAYEQLLNFLESEYIPASRTSIALEDLPGGEAWYRHNVRQLTTTDMTPEQIHELGLSEVKRIRAEMDAIIRALEFDGGFEDFLHFLRTDPQFYHTTAEGLLAEYRDISKRADPELMKLFGHLPRTPYGVIEIPSYAAKSTTTAYYMRGSTKAGRPGYFYANTYALDTRPRWEMEALTLHEAVPGHHLQIAIQDELEDVPWFRRVGGYTAFVEGWGLYAESLGEEMGFYQDPYSKFGQLTYEMWRAIRLVVDTGMHHKGWTRQQAIDYFMANAGKQEHDVIVEIDRYIVWPGQALAYKIGELKIKELRAWASNALGEDFDIRGFHDVVLGSGSVPLNLLEANVQAWLAQQLGG